MDRRELVGSLQAAVAFALWGITPLYWAPLRHISATELLIHRIAWSWLIAWVYLAWCWAKVKVVVRDPKSIGKIALSGTIVVGNWLIYTWAITSGRAVEASLGYYINPLVSVLLGMIFLGERLRGLQVAAFISAILGVGYLTLIQGALPWVSIALPLCFGTYGLIKKRTPVEPMVGLGLETALYGPVAMAWIFVALAQGRWSFVHEGWGISLLLWGSGLMTILPLLLFAGATQRIPLASVGFIQYIAPTLILIFGATVLEEPFPPERLPGFLLVWIGLALYSIATFRRPGGGPRRTRDGRGKPPSAEAGPKHSVG